MSADLDDPCPQRELHTPCPEPYLGWHAWAEEMERTHRPIRCPGCRLFKVWRPIKGAPKLPPVEYRLDHKSCNCCEGDPKCDCEFHQPRPDSWWRARLAEARQRRDARKEAGR